MSVVITNVSPNGTPNDQEHDYIVRMNFGSTLAKFKHVRNEGLAQCLRRAADAIEKEFDNAASAFADTLRAHGPDHS